METKRICPERKFYYIFSLFEVWADKNKIGLETKDWILYWNCWIDGYENGIED